MQATMHKCDVDARYHISRPRPARRAPAFLRATHLCGSAVFAALMSAHLCAPAQKPPVTPALKHAAATETALSLPKPSALVVGFMGGHIKANNLIHKEAVIAKDLRERNRGTVEVLTFANHDSADALAAVLRFVDADHDGTVSEQEKRTARIVLYGHSWGASETVHLARQLSEMNVPVLLTIQVDSVQKRGEDDGSIPANVQQAMNFFQSEGLLHGRTHIRAADPRSTVILGNDVVSYKKTTVDCRDFPWFARTFMKPHIEIENDPAVWNRVEAMIQSEVDRPPVQH